MTPSLERGSHILVIIGFIGGFIQTQTLTPPEFLIHFSFQGRKDEFAFLTSLRKLLTAAGLGTPL